MFSLSKCRAKLRIPLFLRHYSFPASQNRTSNFLRTGALHNRRKCHLSGSIQSLPVGISWMWPSFGIWSNSFGNCQSKATEASSLEKTIDGVLKHVLSTHEDSLISYFEVCTPYIDKLCNDGNLQAAVRLMQSLRDKNLFLSSQAYNCLMKVAGEVNDVDLVSQCFKDLLVSSQSVSSSSYFILAKAFRGKEDDALLLRFVREISRMTFPRNASVLNRIIFVFADCGQIARALLIFHEMKNLKCKPDLITYNIVLQILGQNGRMEEMVHEFALMKVNNLVPDTVTYNTMINSSRKVGRLDLCIKFYKEMIDKGVDRDLRTYTALIESFGKSGNIEEAIKLFNEMKLRHIRPSVYIYRSLIQNLKKVGKSELAMAFSAEMNTCLSELVGPKDFKLKKR